MLCSSRSYVVLNNGWGCVVYGGCKVKIEIRIQIVVVAMERVLGYVREEGRELTVRGGSRHDIASGARHGEGRSSSIGSAEDLLVDLNYFDNLFLLSCFQFCESLIET